MLLTSAPGLAMTYEERKQHLGRVESLREGRKLVCFFTFDRQCEPRVADLGLEVLFQADAKEALFRVLKETRASKIDVCLYTRGGDVNGVWPLVSVIREFDPDFEVLVPSGATAVERCSRWVRGEWCSLRCQN
jgi:hypothetical protein